MFASMISFIETNQLDFIMGFRYYPINVSPIAYISKIKSFMDEIKLKNTVTAWSVRIHLTLNLTLR
jgi:hypothetical protein